MCRTSSRRSINLYPRQHGGRLNIIETSCPPRQEWPKSWSNIEDPVWFLSNEICTDIHQYLFVHWKHGLSVYVDDVKMYGKKQNVAPMWKKLMKLVDLDEPTSFVDHVYLGRTERERKPNENIIEEYNKMFETQISAEATEKWPGWKTLTQRQFRGPTIWKDMPKNALSDTVNWQTRNWRKKKTEQLYKVSTRCLDDHHFKERKNWQRSENCPKYALKSSRNACILARIGRLAILRSVNKLARSVTNWTQACDRRLARFISYIHHTSDYRQYTVMWENRTTLSIGITPRLRLCWGPRRFLIDLQGNLMYL